MNARALVSRPAIAAWVAAGAFWIAGAVYHDGSHVPRVHEVAPSSPSSTTVPAARCIWPASTCSAVAVTDQRLRASCGAGYVLVVTVRADGVRTVTGRCAR